MTILLSIVGLIIALLGLTGCILPVIPGPVFSFLSLVIISWAKNWEPFSIKFLIIMACIAILLTVLDYFVAMFGAKKYGASKAGIWGSFIGMIVGIFVFPPWGIIAGALVGAMVGELLVGKAGPEAIKVGWGVFVGNMVGAGIKFAFCCIVLFLYIKELF